MKTVVDDEGLRMELKNALLFDSGQADITPTGRAAIDRVGKLLPTIDSRYQIAIEGHTDDVPIHTAPVRLELGAVVGAGDQRAQVLHRGGGQPAAAFRAGVRRHAAGHARRRAMPPRRRAPAPKIAGW